MPTKSDSDKNSWMEKCKLSGHKDNFQGIGAEIQVEDEGMTKKIVFIDNLIDESQESYKKLTPNLQKRYKEQL